MNCQLFHTYFFFPTNKFQLHTYTFIALSLHLKVKEETIMYVLLFFFYFYFLIYDLCYFLILDFK